MLRSAADMAKTARSETVMDKFQVPSSYSSSGALISQQRP
jgi:hypothetical protein